MPKDYKNLYFVMHCSESKRRLLNIRELGYLNGCRYRSGVDFLWKHEILGNRTVLVHCIYIDQYDISMIKEHNARVVVRPKMGDDGTRRPLKKLWEAGIRVGFGSDVPVKRDGMRRGFSIIPEVYRAMNIYGLSFAEAFYIATEGGAEVFDLKPRRIEVGSNADFVLFDTQRNIEEYEKEGNKYTFDDLNGDLIADAITRVIIGGDVEYPFDEDFLKEIDNEIKGNFRAYITTELKDNICFQPQEIFGQSVDATRILGYYNPSDGKVYINNALDRTVKGETCIHEGLHFYSVHDGKQLQRRFNEGVTEYFTKKKAASVGLENAYLAYRQEVEIVSQIADKFGGEALKKAYFQGEVDALKTVIDEQLGEGAFDEISQCLEDGNYYKAKKILKQGI